LAWARGPRSGISLPRPEALSDLWARATVIASPFCLIRDGAQHGKSAVRKIGHLPPIF